MKLRTRYPLHERTAITEICALVELLDASNKNQEDDRLKVLCCAALERVANIIRGEGCKAWTNEEVVEFANVWRVDERARFNPPPGKRKRGRFSS